MAYCRPSIDAGGIHIPVYDDILGHLIQPRDLLDLAEAVEEGTSADIQIPGGFDCIAVIVQIHLQGFK